MARKKPLEQPLPAEQGWRQELHEIIFEADTPAGKVFDVGLLIAIVLSVLAVMMESVEEVQARYGDLLRTMEWTLTVLFTTEYAVRLICVRKPLRYATSFFGVVDLLAILPTYLSLLFVGAQSLLVIRALRLLRIFRVLKLAHLLGEAQQLTLALQASVRKIGVFLFGVLTLVLIIGSVMYLVEGGEPGTGFTSIPQSIYWGIVTMTTVGYGDIAPQTNLGKFLASFVMILGYGIIAVPTGIVTVELNRGNRERISTQSCQSCSKEGHHPDAVYCYSCGEKINP